MPVRIYVNFGSDTNFRTNQGVEESSVMNDNNNGAAIVGNTNTINNVQAKNSKNKAAVLAMGKMMALQSINYGLSNVGQWSGNEQNQVAINNVQDLVGIGIMASASPWLAVGTVGFKLATTAIDENIRKRKESVGLAQAQARAGYPNGYVANYRKR